MAAFSFDAGIFTSIFPIICALRMRVSMSATGSVIPMRASLPARLDDARHFAAHRELTQLGSAQAELAIPAAWPPGGRAAVAQPHRGGLARQLLQLCARR